MVPGANVAHAADMDPGRGTAHTGAVAVRLKNTTDGEKPLSIPSKLNSSSSSAVVVLCFSAVLLDGLDTSSIGVAGPTIAAHFGVAPAALTAPFVMTSIGAVIGYLLSGSLVDRWNARRILLISVIAFGVLSLVTPHAGSIVQLAILRLITAVGLGAALPSAISIAVEQSPQRLRAAVTAIVATGLAAGGVLGGMLGGIILKRYGWEQLFYLGGALPLALSICLWRWLPTGSVGRGSTSVKNDNERQRGSVKGLLAEPVRTAGLWVFSFLIFAAAYALLFWLPSLLVGFGCSPQDAQFGVGVFSAGGLLANIALVLLVSRFAVASVMLTAAAAAGLCALGIALDTTSLMNIWPLLAGTGAGLIACSVGQSALAVSIYRPLLRTTGVGFSAAAGRVGSIVGPGVVGLLFSLGWAPRSIFLAAAAPILIAMLALVFLARAIRRDAVGEISSG